MHLCSFPAVLGPDEFESQAYGQQQSQQRAGGPGPYQVTSHQSGGQWHVAVPSTTWLGSVLLPSFLLVRPGSVARSGEPADALSQCAEAEELSERAEPPLSARLGIRSCPAPSDLCKSVLTQKENRFTLDFQLRQASCSFLNTPRYLFLCAFSHAISSWCQVFVPLCQLEDCHPKTFHKKTFQRGHWQCLDSWTAFLDLPWARGEPIALKGTAEGAPPPLAKVLIDSALHKVDTEPVTAERARRAPTGIGCAPITSLSSVMLLLLLLFFF
ncbi:uncharacterized protein [Macaca nemestrina]|uniref:uncharacterized protein n=1 Tax=Macaca nemestrina TaxID=9545 RepID=UPI0039B8983C